MSVDFGRGDLSSNTSIRTQIDLLRKQISLSGERLTTGKISHTDVSRNGLTDVVYSSEKELSEINVYSEAIKFGKTLFDSLQLSMGKLRASALDLTHGVLSSLSGGATTIDSKETAKAEGYLRGAVSSLNQSVVGKSLFSGAALTSSSLVQADQIISDVENILSGAPDIATGLAAVDFYFDDPAGGFVNTVYVGSNLEAPSLEISKNEFLTQPIRADRQEIKDTVKIFAITAAVHNGATSSTSDRKVALEYVGEQGLKINEKLIETERLIGERQEILERTEMHLNSSKLVLEKAYNSATSVDVFKEAAIFEEFQVQLETSYKVLVRLSSLKLTNFI